MVIDFDFYREKFKEVESDGFKPSKPTNWKALKNKCVAYRNDYLDKINEDKPKNQKVKKLSELKVTEGINKLCHVVTLPNGRIAIYDPDKGFYHKDPRFAYKIIHLMEPTFNETK